MSSRKMAFQFTDRTRQIPTTMRKRRRTHMQTSADAGKKKSVLLSVFVFYLNLYFKSVI